MIIATAFGYYLLTGLTRIQDNPLDPGQKKRVQLIFTRLKGILTKIILLWPIYIIRGCNNGGPVLRRLALPIVSFLFALCLTTGISGFIPVYLLVGFLLANYALFVYFYEVNRLSN